MQEKHIDVIYNSRINKIEADGVTLSQGGKVSCNVAVWATGAEP